MRTDWHQLRYSARIRCRTVNVVLTICLTTQRECRGSSRSRLIAIGISSDINEMESASDSSNRFQLLHALLHQLSRYSEIFYSRRATNKRWHAASFSFPTLKHANKHFVVRNLEVFSSIKILRIFLYNLYVLSTSPTRTLSISCRGRPLQKLFPASSTSSADPLAFINI